MALGDRDVGFVVEAVVICTASVVFAVLYVLFLRREAQAIAAANAAAHPSAHAHAIAPATPGGVSSPELTPAASTPPGGGGGGGSGGSSVVVGSGVLTGLTTTALSNFPFWGRRLGLLLSVAAFGQGIDSQRGLRLYGAPVRAAWSILVDTLLFVIGSAWLLAMTELLYKQLHGSLRAYPTWLRVALFAYPPYFALSSAVLMVVCGTLDVRSIAFFQIHLASLAAVQASLFVLAYLALRDELVRVISKRQAAAAAAAATSGGGGLVLDVTHIKSSLHTLALFTLSITGVSCISVVFLALTARTQWDLDSPYNTDPPAHWALGASLPTYVVTLANGLVCWYTSPYRFTPPLNRTGTAARGKSAAAVAIVVPGTPPMRAARWAGGTISSARGPARGWGSAAAPRPPASGGNGTNGAGRSGGKSHRPALLVLPGSSSAAPTPPDSARGPALAPLTQLVVAITAADTAIAVPGSAPQSASMPATRVSTARVNGTSIGNSNGNGPWTAAGPGGFESPHGFHSPAAATSAATAGVAAPPSDALTPPVVPSALLPPPARPRSSRSGGEVDVQLLVRRPTELANAP